MLQLMKDYNEPASLLSEYWQERGMSYNKEWANEYLKEGHKKEIKEDLFYTYKEEDKVIGMVSLVIDVSGLAEIRDLVVNPEYRKKGYSKQILQELEMVAIEKGLRKIFALVFPELQKLFSDSGFSEEGFLRNHFAEGEDLIIMSKFI